MNGTITDAEADLRERIEEALDRIRPAIQSDGGDVELVSVQEGVASVRMLGACVRCPMSHVTLQMGIEYTIKENVPEIHQVVPVPWEDDIDFDFF